MKKIFIFGIVFLTIGAAAVYWVSPRRVYADMLKKIESLNSARVEARAKSKLSVNAQIAPLGGGALGKETEISVLAKGDYSWKNPANPLLSGFIDAEAGAEESKILARLEARYKDNAGYLKILKLPEIFGGMFGQYLNVWLKFPVNRIPKSISPDALADKISAEKRQTAIKLLAKHKPFKIERKNKFEKIDGAWTIHLVLIPDPEKFKKFLIEYEQTFAGRELSGKELDEIDARIKEIGKSQIDVWASIFRRWPYKFLAAGNTSKGEKVEISLLLNNHNKPVAVEVPEEAKTLEEAVGKGLSPRRLMPGAPAASQFFINQNNAPLPAAMPSLPDFNSDADKDGLPDTAERFYGSNPNLADTDSDGISDGDEVNNAQNPNGPGGLYDFGVGM